MVRETAPAWVLKSGQYGLDSRVNHWVRAHNWLEEGFGLSVGDRAFGRSRFWSCVSGMSVIAQ